ncbi:hypothetical protein [Planococcus ruber]|uniref:hypothetical protein n=1 Tax=Planococcus ruber TaxID=2027871 RepID=UPI001FEEFE0B|nr:hypothetical protein [Planococcus ruber]MCJ1906938.1 hypothetical protein [Planococcus ruber]
MIRKIVLSIAVFFFMALILFTGMMFLKNETEVYSLGEMKLMVEKPTFFTLSEAEPTEDGEDLVYEHAITFFGIPLGTYTLVERTLENGVAIVFEEINNTSWMPYALSLNTNGLKEAKVKSWNEEPISREEDPVYGIDPTRNPFGTISSSENEILQGNLYISRQIPLGNGNKVQELRHEIPDLTLEEGSLLKSFWLPPKHQAQTWFMLGQTPFFESEEKEDEWIQFAAENRRQQLNWLTPAGPLVKVEQTDDLRTELAYDLNEDRTADMVSAEWNEKSPSLFFESMELNAEINLSK